jgi:hypothetical protein
MMSEINYSICDKAIAIIHNTQDGNLLSPSHLKLTEMAVNGHLNDKGIVEFNKLYAEVISGEYKQPFLHGVEHMAQDHEGYILFKGKAVEHYSTPWVYSLDAKNSLIKLQMQCLFLESKGITPSPSSCVWSWELDEEYGEYKKAELDNLLAADNGNIVFSEITADNNNCQIVTFFIPGNPDEAMIYATNDYIDFLERNGDNGGKNFNIQSITFSYGNGNVREATEDELKIILCCFGYLKGKDLLIEEAVNAYGSREHNRYDEDYSEFSQEQKDQDEYDEEL